MKSYFVLFVFLLLFGCTSLSHSALPDSPEQFNLSFHNITDSDANNKTTVSFLLQNNELFDLDCRIDMLVSNVSSEVKQQGTVQLASGATKNISFTFEMLVGNSSLEFSPDCKRTANMKSYSI